MSLKGKKILLGITGGVAAYKAAPLVRKLRKKGAQVRVVLTQGAEAFVTPLLFEALSGVKVFTQDDFLRPQGGLIPHVSLGQFADLILVSPATAAFLASLRVGDASSLLVACIMASEAKVLLCPAMNEKMWRHPATQENVRILKEWGYKVLSPEKGALACGDTGPGRLPSEGVILAWAKRLLTPQDLQGVKVLVACGPTREPIDLVRYLSNRSSGRMGLALAYAAFERGAEVTLVHGPLSMPVLPLFQEEEVETAEEMYRAVLEKIKEVDVFIMVAAVADFTPQVKREGKIKKDEGLQVDFVPTKDILSEVARQKRPGQVIVGFAAEEEEALPSEAQRKLKTKGIDILVANPIDRPGVGFESEANEVLILTSRGQEKRIGPAPKEEIAHQILDELVAFRGLS